ncbi:MAG: hypothetical protein D6820_04780 [Lentisphaerae bacterium]|nr:MAG: hypothetical protein D6820_04780 [Lentisphaerota bacterium]
MKRHLSYCNIALAGLGLANSTMQASPVSRKPNIIFIITDDMQKYMCNFLPEGKGKNLTPNLDRLAAEGTVMLGQHVSSTVCTPSRFSCLTGMYASRARNSMFLRGQKRFPDVTMIGWNSFILPQTPTLPKLLRKLGYVTGAVGKNHVIECPQIRKVPYTADPRDPKVVATLKKNQEMLIQAYQQAGFDYASHLYDHNPDNNGPRALAVHNMDWIMEGACEFIERYAGRPFFLYLATTIPHGPMEPKRSWKADRRLTPVGILDSPLTLLPSAESIEERLRQAGLPADRNTGNMLWLDDALGLLLKRLRERKVLDNTIIFFFNDHGQLAKGTIYQGGTSDPSVVWRKGGFPCGHTSRALVSNIDFAPTILEIAGGDPDKVSHFDGKSFWPVLLGKKQKVHDYLYFEIGFTRGIRVGDWKYLALRYPQKAMQMSLTQRKRVLDNFNRRMKLHGKRTFTEDPSRPFSHVSLIPGGGGAEHASYEKYPAYHEADQLYNLAQDPNEQHNLARDPNYAGKLKEMQRILRSVLRQLPGNFAEFTAPSRGQ